MRGFLSLGCVLVFLCSFHSVMCAEDKSAPPRAESDPDALPSGAIARFGGSPLRIGDADFAFAPDGKTIVAVTPQGILRRFDAQTGRLLERRQLSDRKDVDPMHNARVQLAADGRTVALEEGSYTGPRVTVYDVASGKQIFRRASTETKCFQLGRLSPDGKHLALRQEDGDNKEILQLFDLQTGQMHAMGSYHNYLNDCYFSGDGKRLLVIEYLPPEVFTSTLSLDNRYTVLNFDLTSGKELWRQKVTALNFAVSRDGKMVLASGYRDATYMESGFHVVQREANAKEPSVRFATYQRRPDNAMGLPMFHAFLLAPDNRTLVIKGNENIHLWDLHTAKEIRRFQLPKNGRGLFSLSRMAISNDGRKLLTNADYLQCWDLTTGKPLFEPPPDNNLPDYPIQLAFTPDGKEIVGCSNRWQLGRWNVATGKRIDVRRDDYGGTPFIRTPDGVRAIRFDNRDKQFRFIVFDPVAHKDLHTIRWPDPDGVGTSRLAYTLTADGKTLLVIHSGKGRDRMTAWQVATGHKLSDFSLTIEATFAKLPFSPCGRWVMLHDKLHHVGSGAELFEPSGLGLPGKWMNYGNGKWIWFSEDGRLLAACLGTYEENRPAAYTLAVWELASGQTLAQFHKPGFVARAAFAPDGRTLALLDAQGVRLEDLLSGKRLATYPASDVICDTSNRGGEHQGLTFSPDGSTLATAHQDGSVLLWKVPRSRSVPSFALADGEAEQMWSDLGSSYPATGRAALEKLICHPEAATALLTTRFRPPPADAKLPALLNDLDSDVFATREEASRKLRAYGARAEGTLQRTLTQAPSLEMRRRIEGILADMAPLALRLPLSGDRLRSVRAIEVWERIGNASARKALQAWAEQTEDVQLAVEARLALARLMSANGK